MSGRPARRARRSLVAAAAVVGTALAVLVPSASASTAVHRAAIVVDTGTELKTARVTFTSDSITGLQALQLAGFSPEVRAFAGAGAALCKMCGKGCPTDGSCLTCSGATYWAYYRAPAGATAWTYSPVGAGATTVRDGDVEGWHWGKGTPPPFVSFARIWGEQPAPTTLPASPPTTRVTTPTTAAVRASGETTPPPPSGPSPNAPVATAPAGSHARGSTPSTGPGTAPTSTPSSTRTRASATSTAAAPRRTAPTSTDGRDGTAVAVAPIGSGRSGGPGAGSWPGLVAFGVLATGLLTWTVVARRARRGGGAHDVAPPTP